MTPSWEKRSLPMADLLPQHSHPLQTFGMPLVSISGSRVTPITISDSPSLRNAVAGAADSAQGCLAATGTAVPFTDGRERWWLAEEEERSLVAGSSVSIKCRQASPTMGQCVSSHLDFIQARANIGNERYVRFA